MNKGIEQKIAKYFFRQLHPHVYIGTASDRYAGWIEQIYTKERYLDRIVKRSKRVGGKTFVEQVLPVESVKEYFQHFRVLEIDFTFYSLLLEENGKRSKNYHVLETYKKYLKEGDRLILKVPQVIFAKKLRRGRRFVKNEMYLNSEIFTSRFYEPGTDLLGLSLVGLVFEQEYHMKKERVSIEEQARDLDRFFSQIPGDTRYHVELRTEAYLSETVFGVLRKHGVGLVLSHWTWLPSLYRQFELSGGAFFNAGKQCIVRLMTPRGMRYEDAYAKAHPFNTVVDGMLSPRIIKDTTEIMLSAINEGVDINIIINNRAGGNAPQIAREIAREFLYRQHSGNLYRK